jgi:protein O-mannosyl-transferase
MKLAFLQHKRAVPCLLLALLVITFVAYEPGLYGNFIFDDQPNIVTNDKVHPTSLSWEAIRTTLSSGVASRISRPLSMLTFGLNYYLTGLNPLAFKLTNLLMHLLVSGGVYLLSRELLYIGLKPAREERRRLQLLALFVTACWALHPANVSTVLYVVQRMTVLSAGAAVYGLFFYCKFRQDETASRSRAAFAFLLLCLLLTAGILFKENAALLVLFILAVEVFLLHFDTPTAGQTLFLRLYLVLLLVLPAVLALLVLVFRPDLIIGGYGDRDFTLWERLMTEARVIWMYIYWLLMPDTRAFTFFHDGYLPSRGLFQPVTTAISIISLVALVLFTWIYRKRFPLFCFGIAFFLAGHTLESTIVPLELVFEHRNYLPGIGLLFGCIYMLLNLPGHFLQRGPAAAFLGLFLFFLAQGTFMESTKWSNVYKQLIDAVVQNPDSHRINYELGYFHLHNAPKASDTKETLEIASEYFRRSTALDPRATRGHVGFILAESQQGNEPDKQIVDDLTFRLQHRFLTEDTFVDISMLTECWYGGFCKFDKSLLAGIYNAVANNDVSVPILAQGILDQVGTAIANVFNNREDGKALLYLARSLREDVTVIDLKLIRFEMSDRNYDKARELLLAAEARPHNEDFAAALASLASELAALEDSRNTE